MFNEWIKKKKESRFREREPKSFDEIYKQYFARKGYCYETCRGHWCKVADLLRLNPDLLLPDDRFDQQLAPVQGFSVDDELEDLSEWLSAELEKKNPSLSIKSINTLEDLIDALSQK